MNPKHNHSSDLESQLNEIREAKMSIEQHEKELEQMIEEMRIAKNLEKVNECKKFEICCRILVFSLFTGKPNKTATPLNVSSRCMFYNNKICLYIP